MIKSPPKNTQRLTPRLAYDDAPAAIDFLCRAFGFEETARFAPGGKVIYSEIALQGETLFAVGSSHEAARSRLRPFSPGELLALIEGGRQFEASFGLRVADGLRELFVSDEVSPSWLAKLRASSNADPWIFGFAIIHLESNSVIGSVGFKGPPDEDGMVEIAYGIAPDFQGKGYATEAAAAGVAFAFGSSGVRLIRAHTLPTPNASTRVLSKCGFEYTGEVVDPEDGPVWRWELSRESVKQKGAKMTSHAKGTFDVKMTPQAPDDTSGAATIGRFSLDKQFHGDIEGVSKGEMLAVSSSVQGSAGYVAMEQVTGTLNGLNGSFALQHTGVMTRGEPQLIINVVPDSGAGDLAGLSGRMTIDIKDGQHFYDFEYTFTKTL